MSECPAAEPAAHASRSEEEVKEEAAATVEGDADDAHCHVHCETPAAAALRRGVLRCVCGVEPADWALLAAFAAAHAPGVAPAYGVHPWHAPRALRCEAAVPWRAQLAERLCVPCAPAPVCWPLVGEIGLDHAATDRDTGEPLDAAAQDTVFAAQWALAVRLRRGVCVHCVRAHGALFDRCRAGEAAERARLKKKASRPRHASAGAADAAATHEKKEGAEEQPLMPPVVLLHSYSGSADIAAQLLRLTPPKQPPRYFFGFSGAVNKRNWPAALRVLQALPRDRVLAESDLAEAGDAQAACNDVVAAIAGAWRCGVDEARATLRSNLERFFEQHNRAAAQLTEAQCRAIAQETLLA